MRMDIGHSEIERLVSRSVRKGGGDQHVDMSSDNLALSGLNNLGTR